MNKAEFKFGLELLSRNFSNKEIDVDVLWMFLSDLDGNKYMDAINKLIMTEESINASTNLVAIIRRLAVVEQKETAEEAWREVLGEIRRVGSYGSPHFENSAIKKAVECLGWRNLCLSENVVADRAHFYKTYDAITKRNEIEEIAGNNVLSELMKRIGDMKNANIPKRITKNP